MGPASLSLSLGAMALDTEIILVDGPKDMTSWYQSLVLLVQHIQRCEHAEIRDNGFASHPGVFVAEGVEGRFRSSSFSIWSDVPGEIILQHKRNSREADMLKSMLQRFFHGNGT